MMAGNLTNWKKYAAEHEMSNQQLKKQSLPDTNLDRLGKTGGYLQLRTFTFFAQHSLYLGPVLDPASW